jgi:signal transduction histidine kinase
VIPTDRTKLKQVLLHLVSNAVKFTERGTVEVGSERHGDRIVIRVRDSGIGIAAQDVDRLWEPFWQAQQAPSRRAAGTGLGLSLGRRLARLLGGEISVESELGVGSTFTLELPRVHAAQSSDAAN